MKTFYNVEGTTCAFETPSFSVFPRITFLILLMLTVLQESFSQTTYNFSAGSTLSSTDGFYNTQALITVDGVVYKLTHLGNGSFTNQGSGGNGNSACLKKDGSGGDFLRIERNDLQPFQFYGMWLNTSSMYNPPWYFPPYYDIKYYDENSVEIVAETFTSNAQYETITVVKNLKVKYVKVTLNAITVFKLDDLIVGPAAASPPTSTTASINQFTASSFLGGGNVTSDGGATVTERGIVYSTATGPTIANNKIQIGTGTGTFSQSITGLNSSTMYYVKAYAINSAGVKYGSEVTVTTAAPFVLAQTHYFNTSWVSTNTQPSPFTKYVEGWSIKATSTGTGTVSVSRITALTGVGAVGEGVASARAISNTAAEQLASVSYKTSDNSLFKLNSFKFKYLTKVLNTSFGTITVTGYLDGVAVPGAVITLTGIAQATTAAYAYTTVDASANSSFGSIDEFVITASDPVSSAKLNAIDVDVLVVGEPVIVPIKLSEFTGKLSNGQSVLTWKTAQEQDTKDFDIQYSTDGRQFSAVAKVNAAGNSATIKSYSFTHPHPAAGNNYYRLKMNDQDGKFTYSHVLNLKMGEGAGKLSVYPNPVMEDHFYVNTSADVALPLSYKLINSEGKTVQKGTISTHNQKISLQSTDKGNYFIQLSNGQTVKVIL